MTILKIERRSSSFVAPAALKGPPDTVEEAERQSRCIGNWLSRNTIDESYRRRTDQPIEPNLAELANFPRSRVSANPRLVRAYPFAAFNSD